MNRLTLVGVLVLAFSAVFGACSAPEPDPALGHGAMYDMGWEAGLKEGKDSVRCPEVSVAPAPAKRAEKKAARAEGRIGAVIPRVESQGSARVKEPWELCLDRNGQWTRGQCVELQAPVAR